MDVGQYEASMAYSLLVIAKALLPKPEEPKRFAPDFFHRDVCQDPTCSHMNRRVV